MKNVSKAILACLVLCATIMSGCDKTITTSPLTVDKTQKGIIKGYVYANTDLTSYGNELAPAGTKVIITMNYSDISGLESSSSVLNDTVLIGNDGSFQYTVPTDADGVNVYVYINFVYDQIQPLGGQYTTIKKSFVGSTTYYAVKAKQTQSQEITVDEDATLQDNTPNWHTVSGTIYANYDESVAGNEKLPAGTQIIFHTTATGVTAWSKTVTVGTDGKYTVSVPENEDIYIDYNFTLSGKISGGTAVTWRFKDSNDLIDYFSADAKNEDIILSDSYKTAE